MLTFAGVTKPSYFRVNKIQYSILPSIESKTEKVYGRAGEYDFGIEIGTRSIKIDFQIIGDNNEDVIKKARLLSTWLFHEDLQPLIIADEPDKQYKARVINDTEVEENLRVGSGTIEFLVPDGYAESIEDKTFNATPTTTDPVNVVNNGTVEAYPLINLTMRANATSISVISDDKFVLLGENSMVEKTDTAINPIVLSDDFTSFAGWATGTNVDGGTVTGTFSSNGYTIWQSNRDYGTGSTWHGAAAIKSLSRAVTDFQVDALVGLDSTKIDQIGRVEVYLLDSNNTIMGKIALKDMASDGEFPMFEARAGDINGGELFVADYGSKKGAFANFRDGVIRISRKGNVWTAYIAKIDPTTKEHHTRLTKQFVDSKGLYDDKQLAKIQIHAATHGTRSPVYDAFFADLKVRELTASSINNGTQTPIVFNSGDIVTIDNQRAIVLKNGEPIFTELDPSSDFFSLKKGANGLVVTPPVADISVTYRERWL
ncbi:distal tail protein Dit [Priestia megaterium]